MTSNWCCLEPWLGLSAETSVCGISMWPTLLCNMWPDSKGKWRERKETKENFRSFRHQTTEVMSLRLHYSWLEQSSPPRSKGQGNRFHFLTEERKSSERTQGTRNLAVAVFEKHHPPEFTTVHISLTWQNIAMPSSPSTRSRSPWQEQDRAAKRPRGCSQTVRFHLYKVQKQQKSSLVLEVWIVNHFRGAAAWSMQEPGPASVLGLDLGGGNMNK